MLVAAQCPSVQIACQVIWKQHCKHRNNNNNGNNNNNNDVDKHMRGGSQQVSGGCNARARDLEVGSMHTCILLIPIRAQCIVVHRLLLFGNTQIQKARESLCIGKVPEQLLQAETVSSDSDLPRNSA